MFNTATLQAEQAEWALANFGDGRDPSHALMGMMEELGELADAIKGLPYQELGQKESPPREETVENIKDALGDFVIYAADYCTLKGWDMSSLCSQFTYVRKPHNVGVRYMELASACGMLSHHHLKSIQGIRGTAEEHDQGGQESMAEALFSAWRLCVLLGFSFKKTVQDVWNDVKKRDWKKDPLTAGGHA